MYFVRKFLLYLIFCGVGWGAFQVPTQAITSLNVTWNASGDTNVLGYKVYYGTVSQQYSNVVVAGNATSTLISGIKPGNTYYFAATSYNAAGWESTYSPQISYTVPVVNPPLTSPKASVSGFSFSVNSTATSQYVIIASTNLVNWVALTTNTAPFTFTDSNSAQYSHRYYQAVLLSMYVPQIAPTQPVVSPALTSPVNGPGGFSFTVNNTAGSPYVIVASTNLINWVAIGTNTAPFTFTDTNSSKFSKRFYKAILLSAYVPQVAPTQPVVSPAITSPVNKPGGFSFTVNNTAGSPYVIVASTNLINWVAIGTNTAPFTFTDTNSSKFSKRFYKAILLSAYVPQNSNISGSAPALSSYGYGTSGFGFTLTGTPNAQYVVLASTNLVQWVPVLTNTAPFIFMDPTANQYRQRFYKAVPLF